MKSQKRDLHVLLGVIFLLCMSIGVLHMRKIHGDNYNTQNSTHKKHALASMNEQDALDYITPLFAAGNISGAAHIIKEFSPKYKIPLIQSILTDDSLPVSEKEKLQLILSTITHHNDNRTVQTQLLELLVKFQGKLPYTYTLQMATDISLQNSLKPLIAWINNSKKKYRPFTKKLFTEGLNTIIDANDTHAFDILISKKMPLTKRKATSLLYKVVKEKRNAAFIPLLVQKVGANANYTDKTKHTLLMHAVLNNDKTITHALLQEHVNPNTITSPNIGTALQLAIEKKYVDIEELLRNYDAKE